jgi:hypothetical protein
MQFSDFVPEHADDKPVPGRWRAREPLVTPSGEFSVVLRAGANDATPDGAMLAEISALVAYVARHHTEALGFLHDDYSLAAEDPGYLASVDVPAGLSTAELGP